MFLFSFSLIDFAQSNKSLTELDQKIKFNLDSLNTEINKLQDDIKNISSEVKFLKLNEENKKQVSEGTNALINQQNSNVSNQLDIISNILSVVGIVLAALLAIFSIIIGFFISRKEKIMSDLIIRSENNLKEQKLLEIKAEEFRKLVGSQLKSLYLRIKNEEYNYLVDKIEKDPNQIKNCLPILISHDEKQDFNRFSNILTVWSEDEKNEINVEYLLILMINQYPEFMAANQKFAPIVFSVLDLILRSINLDRLEIFLDIYIKASFDVKYENIDNEVRSVLSIMNNFYGTFFIVDDLLFKKYQDKNDRFKLLKIFTDGDHNQLSTYYKQKMKQMYSSETNTSDQQAILDAL